MIWIPIIFYADQKWSQFHWNTEVVQWPVDPPQQTLDINRIRTYPDYS